MTARAIDCDPERIACFISGELSDFESAMLEAHLDDCARCREKLDSQTATPDEWSELQSLLSHGRTLDVAANDEDPFVSCSRRSLEQDLEYYRKLLGPTDDPRMLGRISTYEIVGLLGRGGMGVVFKAFDATLNRYVAIKLLAPLCLTSGAAKQRFVREARSAAAVIHENVVGIHSISEWQGIPYLVMTFVRGESLQKRLAQRGALSLKEVLRIGLQVAQGLAAAHAQGLIHRDIKPANILLETEVDRVKISDFGLARAIGDIQMTSSGILLGTPEYMSPEQARDDSLDYRTDLFSLGAVLYEACTGRSPFRASTVYGAIRKVIDRTPPPVQELNTEMPDWMDAVVARLLAKDAQSRFPSAADVAAVLQKCLAHVEQPRLVALPDSLSRRTARSQRAQSRRMIVTVSVTLAAVATGWLMLAQSLPTQSSEKQGRGESTLLAMSESPKTKDNTQEAESTRNQQSEPVQAVEPEQESADARNNADDHNEAAGQPTATAGDFKIRLRKVDGVARHPKSIKMDPAKLFAKVNSQSPSNRNGLPQNDGFGNGVSNAGGGGFAKGFSSGSGGGFTSSSSSTGGRPFNPTLGLAFDIEPINDRVTRSGKRTSSTTSQIVEIGQNLVATGENGEKLEHQADNPITMRSLEFEASIPGAFPVYLEESQQVSKLATLKGELLVTPGRLLIAEFNGTQKQTKVVDGETFSIESITQGQNGIQVTVSLPQTTRQKRARTFDEQFRVLTGSMGEFDVTIEDDEGNLYPSVGAGSGGGSSSGGGSAIGAVPQGNAKGNQVSHSSQSFGFHSLPQDRTIKKICIKMTDRIGDPKSYPFSMKDVPVPFPN
jgi:serine/threonine protein kinase